MDEYSSKAGFDLMNHATWIDTVLTEPYCNMFYQKKEYFRWMDFGAGVYGIDVGEILRILPTAKDIQEFIDVDMAIAIEIFEALFAENVKRAYTV